MYICQVKYIQIGGMKSFNYVMNKKLDIKFSSPVTDHDASDNCGVKY